jgi:formylglycine-generating enzyme required for sulfatase activity
VDFVQLRATLVAQGLNETQIAAVLASLEGGGAKAVAKAPVQKLRAKARGGSAVAQGKGIAAVRGIAVGGDVKGDVVLEGRNRRKPAEKDLEEAYLRHLAGEVGAVSLSGIDPSVPNSDPRERLRLEAVYTGLETTSQTADRSAQEPLWRDQRRLSAIEMLDRHPRLVLLGDPGSGKSTFVHFLALCLAGERLGLADANRTVLTEPLPGREERQSWNRGKLLPVRVILRDFAAEGLPAEGKDATADHLWRFVARTLAKASLGDYSPLLRKRLLAKGGLILLDGLDEVPLAHKRRTQICQAVEGLAWAFGKCRFLITSRTYAYRNQGWRLKGFEEAELAPFEEAQIERFVDRWYEHMAALGRVDAKDAEGKATLLRRAISGSDRLRGLAERPLLLTLMASLHAWRGGSLPERREELYADAVRLLLDLWERNRFGPDPKGGLRLEQPSLSAWLSTDQDAVRRVLEDLAFEAHAAQPDLAGTADIPEDRLVGRLIRLKRTEEVDQTKLVEYLSQRSGLLVARAEGVYTLPHRSFQEYLAACRLTRVYPQEVAKLAREDPDRWREVLLLAAAKAKRGAESTIWSLAEFLCSRVPDRPEPKFEEAWGAHLAGLALVDAGMPDLEELDEAYKARVEMLRTWHQRLIRDERLAPAERAAAGRTLAALRDPRFDPEYWFLPKDDPLLGFVEIPEGRFRMGEDDEQHDVNLPAYYLACWPVTVGQFAEFVSATGHEGVPAEYLARPENEPVVMVSWHDAFAYARWLGERLREEAGNRTKASGWGEKAGEIAFWQGLASGDLSVSLPSEAEWEKAARGEDGRIYPWGKEHETGLANDGTAGIGGVSAVGCFPGGTSPYGVEELSGNVWEWTRSEYRPYPYLITDGRQDLGDSDSSRRVLRGGAFGSEPRNVRCAVRGRGVPANRSAFIGFRVVVAPFRSDL